MVVKWWVSNFREKKIIWSNTIIFMHNTDQYKKKYTSFKSLFLLQRNSSFDGINKRGDYKIYI